MKAWFPVLGLMGFAIICASQVHAEAILETTDFRMVVDDVGRVTSFFDRVHEVEYAAAGQDASLLRALGTPECACRGKENEDVFLEVRHAAQFEIPSRMVWDAAGGKMTIEFDTIDVKAEVRVTVKTTHINLELVSLTPLEKAEAIHWGPLPTTIKETVGEIVGVVRNQDYAIGIQALNVKTIGGLLQNEEGVESARGTAAKATEWGSTLQAYSLDRSRPRNVTVWGGHYPNMPVPPIEGETPVGSKIALFGCGAGEALDRIESIELDEGLPHPVFDGVWSKRSQLPTRPYLIMDFNERDFPQVLGYAVRANFSTIYHQGPFLSWGHFELSPKHFPNGVEGLQACVEKAREKGIHIGVHTLSNFINTNDPYVTPVPDPRLAKTGTGQLTADIDASATEIPVASPEYFNNTQANWLHTVMIGQELIRYGAVSESAPWTLLDCQRGAFGTTAARHKQGDDVAKLLDHPYKVFFSDFEMLGEIAVRLAGLFNETGLMHLDFDGHEGGWSTGQGDYACEFFAKTFYDHLDRPVRHGSSISKHFYWHINSAENWGEPYYAGFRQSQAEYRFNNQPLFDRNFMPRMLGWFFMKPKTTLADIEWMLARSAGYDAGFALQTHLPALRGNRETGAILDAIREWDEARRRGAFSEEQKARLQNPGLEFHLESAGQGLWKLYPFNMSDEMVYEDYVRQPGEPTGAEWEYANSDAKQPLQFFLNVEGEDGSFANFSIEFDDYVRLEVPATVNAGEQLVCDGTTVLRIYDAEGRGRKEVKLEDPVPEISSGKHKVKMTGEFSGEPAPKVVVRFKTRGEPETVRAPMVSN